MDPALRAIIIILAFIIGFLVLAWITERLTMPAGPTEEEPARLQKDFRKDFRNWLINIF